MTKITPDHLTRAAYIYVRQSKADQEQHNHESRRRQYALADRAAHLGWQEVVVVDDDLGRSGSGVEAIGRAFACRSDQGRHAVGRDRDKLGHAVPLPLKPPRSASAAASRAPCSIRTITTSRSSCT